METSIIISSNTSKGLYPDNAPTSFRCHLPPPRSGDDVEASYSSSSSSITTSIALQSIAINTADWGNVPAAVYTTDRHLLLFLHQPLEANAVPHVVISIEETHHTAFSLATKLTNEVGRQLGELEEDAGAAERVIAFSVYQPEEKLMVELGQNIILLIRQELAHFLLSREQLLDLPRMEIDDDRQQRGRGRQVYVQLQAPSYAHSLLFTFGRPISPGRRALPELLKVRLAEMVQYLSSVRMVQDLSYIPTQQLLTSTALFHTVGKKEFFPLSEQQHLSQLTITLHDEFDRPLRVGRGGNSGEPTFVKLLQKTESMATHHHREHIIRLSSLESADIYTTNCAGDFKIQLTDSLLPQAGDSYDHPQQQWQIALSSIYMPTEIDYQAVLSTAARTHGSLFIDIIRGRRIMRVHFDVDAMMEGGTEYDTLTSTRFVDYVNERLSTAEYAQMQDGSGELAIWLVEVEQGQIQLAFAVEKVVRLGGLFAYLLHRTRRSRGYPHANCWRGGNESRSRLSQLPAAPQKCWLPSFGLCQPVPRGELVVKRVGHGETPSCRHCR